MRDLPVAVENHLRNIQNKDRCAILATVVVVTTVVSLTLAARNHKRRVDQKRRVNQLTQALLGYCHACVECSDCTDWTECETCAECCPADCCESGCR